MLPSALLIVVPGMLIWRAGGTEIRMNSVSGNLYVVTSEDASGAAPRVKHKTREERLEVLTQLEGGNI